MEGGLSSMKVRLPENKSSYFVPMIRRKQAMVFEDALGVSL